MRSVRRCLCRFSMILASGPKPKRFRMHCETGIHVCTGVWCMQHCRLLSAAQARGAFSVLHRRTVHSAMPLAKCCTGTAVWAGGRLCTQQSGRPCTRIVVVRVLAERKTVAPCGKTQRSHLGRRCTRRRAPAVTCKLAGR